MCPKKKSASLATLPEKFENIKNARVKEKRETNIQFNGLKISFIMWKLL